jgi:hypothetical protein
MDQIAAVVFLVCHGIVHAAVWSTPKQTSNAAPFDPTHSWALAAAHVAPAPSRTASRVLARVAAVLFVAAGVALAVDAQAWTLFAIAGATIGVVLKALWFNPWLSLGVALDVAVVAAATAGWPPL